MTFRNRTLKAKWIDRWKGRAMTCIASGPSLCAEDVEAVRSLARPTIVTNNTWKMAPWADVLLGFDAKWHKTYAEELVAFEGERVTCTANNLGVESLAHQLWFNPYGNSGTAAIMLAITCGATEVLLLGFDAKPAEDGRLHWHPNHPEPLTNARSVKTWPGKFERVSAHAKHRGCRVLNASRDTALDCFPRVNLDEFLHS